MWMSVGLRLWKIRGRERVTMSQFGRAAWRDTSQNEKLPEAQCTQTIDSVTRVILLIAVWKNTIRKNTLTVWYVGR